MTLKCQCAQVYIDGTHNSHCELSGNSAHTQDQFMKVNFELEFPQELGPWIEKRINGFLILILDESKVNVERNNDRQINIEAKS